MSEKSYNTLAFIIIFVVAIFGVILINWKSMGMPTGMSVYSSESYCEELEIPYTDTEAFIEIVPSQDCIDEPLQYSAKDFKIISECLNINEDNYCEKKNVYFFLDLSNLDKNNKGKWRIKFILYGDDIELSSKYQSISLGLSENSKLSVTFPLNGLEESNKIVSGEYFIETEPTKKVCSGPIVYKNVTRTVRVTKFRTEVKCF